MNQIRPISKAEYEDLKQNNLINKDTFYIVKEELSDSEKLEKIQTIINQVISLYDEMEDEYKDGIHHWTYAKAKKIIEIIRGKNNERNRCK